VALFRNFNLQTQSILVICGIVVCGFAICDPNLFRGTKTSATPQIHAFAPDKESMYCPIKIITKQKINLNDNFKDFFVTEFCSTF
jgi:hypothetical protein